MEKTLQNRIGYFFIGLLIITFLGFYPTYLVKFPRFEGFTSAHHFHGLMALLWILMLIVQPFLIRAKRYSLHRQVGKAAYVIMPLLMLSLFLVARAGYYRNIQVISEADTLAGLTNGIPDLVFLGILFSLGMIYRKNTAYHLRFLASTGLMMLGPGLGRLLIVATGLPVPFAIATLVLLTTGTGLVWLIVDIRQKRSPFPMGTFVGIGVIAFVLAANNHSAWWQGFAKWIATHLF